MDIPARDFIRQKRINSVAEAAKGYPLKRLHFISFYAIMELPLMDFV